MDLAGALPNIPLEVWQRISFVLAALAIIVLLSSEILSPHSSRVNILIDKKKLRIVGTAVAIVFLATAAVQIALYVIAPQ